jgi:hypothetical protein
MTKRHGCESVAFCFTVSGNRGDFLRQFSPRGEPYATAYWLAPEAGAATAAEAAAIASEAAVVAEAAASLAAAAAPEAAVETSEAAAVAAEAATVASLAAVVAA